ncbi:hypothetical protein B0O99DRAFT_598489 [Bisporella sp. PMI_857]|nr:hypothetical protein B0O99DRAFT_598489 [Bisporella sp. PMI_857]
MHPTTLITLLSVILPISALPTAPTNATTFAAAVTPPTRAVILSGTNAGSIYMFGDPAAARQLFNQYGSCGISTYFPTAVPASIPLVAMPYSIMQSYGFAQHNTLCAKIITMTVNGVTRKAAIADTNVSDTHSIDMTSDLWVAFGQPANDGSIIRSVTWSIEGSGTVTPPTTPGGGTTSPDGTCAGSGGLFREQAAYARMSRFLQHGFWAGDVKMCSWRE